MGLRLKYRSDTSSTYPIAVLAQQFSVSEAMLYQVRCSENRCQDGIKFKKNVLDHLNHVATFFSLLPGSYTKFFFCVPAQAGAECPDIVLYTRASPMAQW